MKEWIIASLIVQHYNCHPSLVSGLVIIKKPHNSKHKSLMKLVDEALQHVAEKEIKKLNWFVIFQYKHMQSHVVFKCYVKHTSQ